MREDREEGEEFEEVFAGEEEIVPAEEEEVVLPEEELYRAERLTPTQRFPRARVHDRISISEGAPGYVELFIFFNRFSVIRRIFDLEYLREFFGLMEERGELGQGLRDVPFRGTFDRDTWISTLSVITVKPDTLRVKTRLLLSPYTVRADLYGRIVRAPVYAEKLVGSMIVEVPTLYGRIEVLTGFACELHYAFAKEEDAKYLDPEDSTSFFVPMFLAHTVHYYASLGVRTTRVFRRWYWRVGRMRIELQPRVPVPTKVIRTILTVYRCRKCGMLVAGYGHAISHAVLNHFEELPRPKRTEGSRAEVEWGELEPEKEAEMYLTALGEREAEEET